MSQVQDTYYIQYNERSEGSKTGVVAACIFLGLGAAVCGLPLACSHDKLGGRLWPATSAVNMPAAKPIKTGTQIPRPTPYMPRGAKSVSPSAPKLGLRSVLGLPRRSLGAVMVPQAEATPESTFTYADVPFQYDEVKASEVQEMMQKGWILLDVRPPEQTARGRVDFSTQVPLFVLKEDMSPYGLYQEAVAFGLGGWWMGGRPMKENANFVKQVMEKASKDSPGIIAICQTGLRSGQALKELHLAGYTRLALVPGGFDRVKPGELCDEDSCILPKGANIRLAGSGNVAGILGWKAT